jgi:hypothetical protein
LSGGAYGADADERILSESDAIATTRRIGYDFDDMSECLECAEFSAACHVTRYDFVATK